jgi:hypothetical protein
LWPRVVALALDVFLLLLPFHAEGRVGQHVVKRPLVAVWRPVKAVVEQRVAQHDVVGVLALDQHVRLTDRPRLVVPVLAVELGLGVGVEVADVLFGHGQHAAGAAGGVVDGLDHMAAAQVLLRGQQQVDHQLDDLTRGEVLPGLLVGLFRADPDQFLEDIAHLHVVHRVGDRSMAANFDHQEEQVLLRHVGRSAPART